MARQLRFFSIPVKGSPEVEREMNQFLASAIVSKIEKTLLGNDENAFYTITVEYEIQALQKGNKSFGHRIDYREVLSQKDFALFDKIRDWRLETSKKENIKAYVILTDAQLAEISETRPQSKKQLSKIKNMGKERLEKYGEAILEFTKKEKQPAEQKAEGPAEEDRNKPAWNEENEEDP